MLRGRKGRKVEEEKKEKRTALINKWVKDVTKMCWQ
jgi:hypothetical protein